MLDNHITRNFGLLEINVCLINKKKNRKKYIRDDLWRSKYREYSKKFMNTISTFLTHRNCHRVNIVFPQFYDKMKTIDVLAVNPQKQIWHHEHGRTHTDTINNLSYTIS